MDSIECQKQVEARIRALEANAQQAQIRGIPFTEASRLEFFEFLREQAEKKCKSVRHS